jgi:hypothetical protein
MIYGYARVWTNVQSVAAQAPALRKDRAGKVFREVASGAKTNRAQLRDPRPRKDKRNARLIRITCPGCGYLLRGTQRWLRTGIPTCPNPRCDNYG